jgi:hypothetical protein
MFIKESNMSTKEELRLAYLKAKHRYTAVKAEEASDEYYAALADKTSATPCIEVHESTEADCKPYPNYEPYAKDSISPYTASRDPMDTPIGPFKE